MLDELKNKLAELAQTYKTLAANQPAGASKTISAAVGNGGKNAPADVKLVQQLLNAKMGAKLTEDGAIGPATVGAIMAFQKKIFNGWADGKIDVGGTTWQRLSGGNSTEQPKDDKPIKISTGGNIKKAVGKGQPNDPSDVAKVQILLKFAPADGQYSDALEKAIGKVTADFVISPTGPTMAALLVKNLPPLGKPADVDAKTTERPAITQKGGKVFPQEIVVAAGKGMTAASPVLVLIGGMHGYGGKEMVDFTPSSLFAKAVIIGGGYKDKWSDISAAYQAKFGVALSPSKCSVCGYSAGGSIETWSEFGSFKKVGLIDTLIYGATLSNKVIGSWNFAGAWQTSDPAGFLKRAQSQGAQVEVTSVGHFSYVQYFLSQFGGDLV